MWRAAIKIYIYIFILYIINGCLGNTALSLLCPQVHPKELNNGIINAAFLLLFKDLVKLFASYNDGVINLLGELPFHCWPFRALLNSGSRCSYPKPRSNPACRKYSKTSRSRSAQF